MKCPRCQWLNDAQARFCEECGAGLGIVCPDCGQPVVAGKKFCRSCGAALIAANPSPLSPQPGESQRPAERVLTSRAALEGERKQVTVLFADLKASMELIADRDPEEARGILDPVLELMMEAVHRYEGTVNQIMGDGIMALFGAPVAQEDHAVRACYAALRMQESVKGHSTGLHPARSVPLRFRIGLNSGEVVVRSVGSDLRMDYTAVGQTTHVAARLEQLAEPNTIFISATTLSLAEGFVEARPLGVLPIKGLSRPTAAYELLSARIGKSRFDVLAARGLTRFIGRGAELQQLRRAYEEAAGGTGRVVAIFGEPGIGKSRLLREFARSIRTPDRLILGSECISYGETTAYLPVAALLRQYFQLAGREGDIVVREKVKHTVESLGLTPSAYVAPLMWLLGAEPDDDGWQRLDPAQRSQRAHEAVSELLVHASRAEPLVVILEDLQWVDSETQALLNSLVEHLPASRILLLASYRPGYEHGWSAKPCYRELPIERLSAEDAEELLAALTGDSPGLQPLKQALIQRTSGNAFFLEESVRTLVETEVLVGTPGHYLAQQDAGDVQIPSSVYAVLAARIDRLAANDKRLLQAASVIGMDVPSMLFEGVADLPRHEFRRSIARLESGGFLRASHLHPEIEYTFKHALTCHVAYRSLVLERRRSLHAAIVGIIERLYPDHLAEHVERLAHHALRGEVWPKAVRYCGQAGVRSLARSANRAAVTHLERALEAVANCPESRDTAEAAIDLRLELRNAFSPLGEHARTLETLAQAERLAEQLGDSRRLGLTVSRLSNLCALRGEFDKAIEQGLRALQIADTLDDLPLRVVSNGVLAIAHWSRGEYRPAVARAGWNVRMLTGDRRLERFGMALLPSVYSRMAMAVSLAELGEFDECLALGAEALSIAETSEHPQSVISASFGLGTGHMRRGNLEQAVAVLERGRTVAEATALGGAFLELVSPLASAYARSGRIAQSVELLQGDIARAVALRNPMGHWLRSGGLGEAQLCAGRIAQALPMARLYIEVTRSVGARGLEAWALLLLGEVLAQHESAHAVEAERTLNSALALARQLEMPAPS